MFNKFSVLVVLVVAFIFGLTKSFPALAATATAPPLGVTANFSVLSALKATAAAAGTTVQHNLGLSPGVETDRTGNWIVLGTEYFGVGGLSETAQDDALIAFNNLAGQIPTALWSSTSPAPGVWNIAADTTFTGTLTLTGGYDDIWVFQIGRDMTFSGSVVMGDNAQPCNVFWQIGRSVTIASGSKFVGTLIAHNDVTVVSGATVNGRIMSLTSNLTTDGNAITGPTCVAAPATLHIFKHVVNDNGGTADASNFTMNVTGTNVSDSSFFGAEDPGTTVTLNAGTYSIDEDAFSGYTKSLGDNCSGSIGAGDSKTCIITNNDIPPDSATLRVIKHVVNNNDGTATAADFDLYVKLSGNNIAGSPAHGAEEPGTSYTLSPGTYIVSEDADASYTQSFSGACNSSGSVTLIDGDDETCTITNNDIAQTASNEDEEDNTKDNTTSSTDVAIKVTKKASPSALLSGPGTVTYTYKVTNEGDVALKDISVKDDKCSPVVYVSGRKNKNGKLDTDETWKYICTKRVSAIETNKATAKGTANGKKVHDHAKATVVVSSVPGFPNAGIGPDME